MKENPGRLISVLYRRAQVFWSQALRESGISSAEYPMLLHLYRGDGLTQEEIVGALCIDKAAVARAVQSLTEKGFLEKRKDQTDLRCNRVWLTQKGKESEETVEAVRERWNEILLQHFTDTEKQELTVLLEQAVRNVTGVDLTNRGERYGR